jgi:glutamine cyclotransferase
MARRKRRTPTVQRNRISPWWFWAGGAAIVVAVGLMVNGWFTPQPQQLPELPSPTVPTATSAITVTPAPTNSPTLTPQPTFTAVTTAPLTATATTIALSPVTSTVPALASAPSVYTYTIVNEFPHDRGAFTQGLVHMDGIFFEGTGRYGQSSLRKVDVESGEVLELLTLPPEVFGEGITVFDDRIIQLTWKARTGFEYDKDTFELLRTFSYPTEGWGITHDGERLIMSDGSANLYFWDPDTLEETGRVMVVDDKGPVVRLNELEYVNGEVFANVWQTDRIARIDPDSGHVLGWIILPDMLTAADRSEPVDVLNGIAYNPDEDRLFVTGKLWPKIFEITLTEYE